MEASVAGEAVQGEAVDGAAEQAQEQAPVFDPQPIMQGFEDIRGQLEELRSQMTPQEEAAAADEGLDFSWLDESAGPEGELDPEAFQQNLRQMIQQEGLRAAAPALEAVQEMRIQQQAAALVQEFPAIGEPETAQNVVQGAQELAAVVAQEVGLPAEAANALSRSPALWRVVFMAANAADRAQQQDQAAPGHAHLEGGGSRPAPQQVDPARAIETSGQGSVLPWS
jgi:hypothetical protein